MRPRVKPDDCADVILEMISAHATKKEICNVVGCGKYALNTYFKRNNIAYGGHPGSGNQRHYKTLSFEEYVAHSTAHQLSTDKLRKKLFNEGLKRRVCEMCGLDSWNGQPISLELHHVDGNRDNNQLENLMILCPNCHAQTPTYRGKNVMLKRIAAEGDKRALSSHALPRIGKCSDCNTPITKVSTSGFCVRCMLKHRDKHRNKKVGAVSRDELKDAVRNSPILRVGKMYGVSDNAVRKWLRNYNLPYRSADIKQYTDEEWAAL